MKVSRLMAIFAGTLLPEWVRISRTDHGPQSPAEEFQMNEKMSGRTRVALAAGVIALATAALVYASLPPPNVGSNTVPLGTLADLPVNVLSVDAFTRTITPNGQTNVVLQHLTFGANQSTGWHTHPGPAFALVNAGAFTLTDEHCRVTMYGPGQGFATGLDVHEAVAGPDGADFYAFYFLPEDATVLRTTANPPVCASKLCRESERHVVLVASQGRAAGVPVL